MTRPVKGDDERLLRGNSTQPSPAPVTESRWRGVSLSLSDGPTKIVKSTVTQDRKSSFTRQRQLSDTAFNHLCLTRFVSGAGEVGEATEYATYRQGDSLGWLHRSGVATGLPAMHSSNGPLFHAGSSTKTPLAPIPRSAATSRTVQTPKTRQVMNTVLEFRPAESPISWHRGHLAHVGMISLKLKRLSSQARSAHHFPCVFGPSGDERCKLVNP